MIEPDSARSPLLSAKPLFDLRLSVPPLQDIGGPAGAGLRVATVAGGTFTGERLHGIVEGGSDWQTLRSDGAIAIDARILLKTDEDEPIGLTYRGLRHGSPEVMARLAGGEDVDSASYYFRILCTFATSAPRLEWLNRALAVGTGRRLPAGPVYSIVELD